jgi:hypothetical protein
MPECIIHGCIVRNCGRNYVLGSSTGGCAGIGIGTGAWEDEPLIISDCHAINCGQWGIFTEYQATQAYRGRGMRVVNCTATGAEKGFGDRGTAGTIFTGCVSYGNTKSGFDVSFGARGGLIANCMAYQNGTEGIHFYLDAYGDYAVRGNKCFKNTQRGIFVEAFSNTMRGVVLADNECYGNQFHGILVTSSTTSGALNDFSVRGNRCYNNGQAGASQPHGIRVDANVNGMALTGNRCYDDQATKTQTVGIKLSDSSSFTLTDCRISDNIVTGNGTVGVSLGSVVRTRVAVKNNTGYVTESLGNATIADTTSSVTVTHGLATTPTSVTLGKRTSEDVWVSARTSTTFTVARTGTAGALTFDWSATLTP